MRVEHEGRYAAVASNAGFPRHPVWYFDVKSEPHVELQDGSPRHDEKAQRWERAVAAYPPYAEYQEKTERGPHPRDLHARSRLERRGVGDCPGNGVFGPTRRAEVRRDGHCE
jgi:hypothetical protein